MWAIGMPLHEETLVDHRFGRIMNANIANIMCRLTPTRMTSKVIFVEEPDDSNRLGMKGLGEIGIVGGRPERAQHHRGRLGKAKAFGLLHPADHRGSGISSRRATGSRAQIKDTVTLRRLAGNNAIELVQRSALTALPNRAGLRGPVAARVHA